jgi:serine/threonine-protein kinase
LRVKDLDPTIGDRSSRKGGEISSADLESLPSIPGFVFDCLIGSGGMGRVFKARDEALDRWVAIKLLRSDDPETLARFAREARAQAGIQHDHVCPVYEVGEAEGRPYIVMAYVDGVTLMEAVDEMGLEATVSVVADAADALHAAHRTGLIHRDIKPSNIMVEYIEDLGWHGWVMDFGIAQESTGEDLTVTGATLGTPAFMSPEQVHGGRGRCDRRTDVYGLGATLYRILTGRLPYEGSGAVDVLLQVATVDPPAPRTIRADIPKDLETIVLKCLEKDSNRRYDSAAALADDLRRYLDGEPIQARRADWTYRWGKIIRKHRVSAAVVALSVLAVGVIGGLAIRSVWQARRETTLARSFSQELLVMEARMQKAYLLPLHDLRPEIATVRDRMDRLQTRISEEGSAARGPGYYALGRGHLVLKQYPEALRYLRLTWDGGYRNPDVAYALGQTLGELYQQERSRAVRLKSPAARDQRLREIWREYRDPALSFLQQASDLAPAGKAYAEGLIAFNEERYDEGLDLAALALELDPTLYRARLLEADIEITRGTDLFGSGDVEEAESWYGRAASALEEAVEIGRSDPAVHRSRCRLVTMVLEGAIRRGTAEEGRYREAADVCEDGLRINPDDIGALSAVSQLSWRWGTQLMKIGADPIPVLLQSVTRAEQAVAIDGTNGTALNNLGVAFSKLGLNDLKHGKDPREHLHRAIEAFDRAIGRQTSSFQAINNRGLARWRMGQWAMAQGEDPLPDFEGAAEDFRLVLKIVEKDSPALVNLGAVLLTAGMYRLGEGRDPTHSIDESIKVFENCLEVNPRMAVAMNSMGAAFCLKAEWEQGHGADPRESLDRAIEAFEGSARENPNNTLVYSNLGSAAATRARYELDTGGDPSRSVAEALGWLDTAITLNPKNSTALFNRASVRRVSSLSLIEYGEDPSAEVLAAINDLDRAEAINPGYVGLGIERARIENLKARWLFSQGRDPSGILNRTQRMIERVLRDSPNNGEASIEKARIHLFRVSWSVVGPGRREGEVDSGLVAIGKALEESPDLSDAYSVRGFLLLERAVAMEAGSAQESVAAAAVEAFEHALELNPMLRRKIGEGLEEVRRMAKTGE